MDPRLARGRKEVIGTLSSRVKSLKKLLKLSSHNFSKSGLLFMKESSELSEQLLNGFTRSDLLSMQETAEYLEALLNEFIHDFAKNALLFMDETMVTGRQSSRVESLKALLKLSSHNFSKSGLLFMKENSELLEQLLNGFTRSDLLSMQETGEYLEALLNEFIHDFAKNDLLFMDETMVTGGLKLQSRRVDSLKVLINVFIHNLAKSDLLLLMQETRGRLVTHGLSRRVESLKALLKVFLHMCLQTAALGFCHVRLQKSEETQSQLQEPQALPQSQVDQSRGQPLRKTLESQYNQALPEKGASPAESPQNNRDQLRAWLQKIPTWLKATLPPGLKYTFKRETIYSFIVSNVRFKITTHFYINSIYYSPWWALTRSASFTDVQGPTGEPLLQQVESEDTRIHVRPQEDPSKVWISKIYSDATNMYGRFFEETERVQRSINRDLKDLQSSQERWQKLLSSDESHLYYHFMRHQLQHINVEINNSANGITCEIEQILSYTVKAKKETDKMKEYKELSEYDFCHCTTSIIQYQLDVYFEDNHRHDESSALVPANPNKNIIASVDPHPSQYAYIFKVPLKVPPMDMNVSYPATQPFKIPPNQGLSTTEVSLCCFSPKKSGPHSWDTEIIQHSSDLTRFIQSLPPGLLIQQDAQGRTICHALGSLLGHLSSAELKYLPEVLSRVCPRECMVCQDSFGNTPLHYVVEAQNSNIDVVLKSILKHAPAVAECLVIRNRDNLTPLDLAFEKKLWAPARVLAEHQIKTGTSPVFLQDYFFKAMREQGGIDFLPHLLDLWECYCHDHDHDLNFGVDTTGRTPWWYLVHSNDVSVMCRTLQALKDHSVDLTSLQTHTETGTTLVEEAVEKNRVLFMAFQKVVGWGYNDTHQDTADQDIADQGVSGSNGALSRASSCSTITDPASSDQSESQATQLEPDTISCNGAIDIQDSSTSDKESDSEPRKAAPKSKGVHRQKKKKREKS